MSLDLTLIFPQFNFVMRKTHEHKIYEFEDFRLDADFLLLYEDGQEITLAPKVVETLLALIENGGEVISKDDLMERVWSDSIVEEGNLSQNLYRLRKVLGNTKDGKPFIETLRRRGFRFNGEIVVKTAANDFHNGNHAPSATIIKENPVAELAVSQPQLPFLTNDKQIRPNWLIFISIAAFVGLLLAGFGFLNSRNKDSAALQPNVPNNPISFKRLTPDLNIMTPAISPDGKYLAYIKLEKDKRSIWLKDLSGGDAVEIKPSVTDRADYSMLQFSPDGKQIYYQDMRPNVPNGVILRMPIFGGKAEEIAENVMSPQAVSPDGKQIAFVTENALKLINADGGNERELMRFDNENEWFVAWGSQMAWSADGTSVFACAQIIKDGHKQPELLEISMLDGSRRNVPIPADWNYIKDVAWLADGVGLLITVSNYEDMPQQIWYLNRLDGSTRRLTNDNNMYDWLSLSADSSLLVAQQGISHQNLFTADFPDGKNLKQITFGEIASDGYYGFDFLPDGKIIYASPRTGKLDLWLLDGDENNQRLLTENDGSLNIYPQVTSDGKYIVYVSAQPSGAKHIWRMDADGRNPVQLTDGIEEERVSLSPDGQWIYFRSASETGSSIFKVSINGGETTRLTGKVTTWNVTVSPNGKYFASRVYLENEKQPWKFAIYSTSGGEPLNIFEVHDDRSIVRWMADSKSLIYIKHDSAELWRQPIDGSQPTKFLDLEKDRITNFDISPDYKKFVFSKGAVFSEAVLINNFK